VKQSKARQENKKKYLAKDRYIWKYGKLNVEKLMWPIRVQLLLQQLKNKYCFYLKKRTYFSIKSAKTFSTANIKVL